MGQSFLNVKMRNHDCYFSYSFPMLCTEIRFDLESYPHGPGSQCHENTIRNLLASGFLF